jgi:hypothetical protein
MFRAANAGLNSRRDRTKLHLYPLTAAINSGVFKLLIALAELIDHRYLLQT